MAYAYGHAKMVKPGSSRNVPCKAPETALLVIDVQQYCSRPGQGIFRSTCRADLPYFFDRVDQEMVPNIQRLLSAARRAGTEVIYTVIEALTSDGRDQSLDYKLSGPLLVPKGNPDAAVLPEIRPLADEILLPKTSCSVFCSTNIHYVLRNLGVRYLVVCGQLTNQCVESAVRDAADFGFLVTVAEDACAARSAAEHSSGIHNMKGFARVLGSAELEKELLSQAPSMSAPVRVKRSLCYLNVAYDETYGAQVQDMLLEMFGDVGTEPYELITCNVAHEPFPKPEDHQGFIVMGSVSSCAFGALHESWLLRLLSFLRKLIAEERPLVGVCFGHQAISLALGGVVIQNTAGTKTGFQKYPMTKAAREALKLFVDEDYEVKIFSHHGDAVAVLPEECKSWGYCQSGHWGMTLKKCLTTQAHPEFSTKTGRECLRALLSKDRALCPGGAFHPTLAELDRQMTLLDEPTDYKSIAVAFASVLGLLPNRKRSLS